jgi:hypothetical protein
VEMWSTGATNFLFLARPPKRLFLVAQHARNWYMTDNSTKQKHTEPTPDSARRTTGTPSSRPPPVRYTKMGYQAR